MFIEIDSEKTITACKKALEVWQVSFRHDEIEKIIKLAEFSIKHGNKKVQIDNKDFELIEPGFTDKS